MFDAYEAVDELIDDVNTEYYEGCYEEIYEEICRRVDEGELSLEDGEILNEAAAQKYLCESKKEDKEEDDDEKKVKKAKRKKNIKRAAIVGGAAMGLYGGARIKSGYNAGKQSDRHRLQAKKHLDNAKRYENSAKKIEDKINHKKKLMKQLGVGSKEDYNNALDNAFNKFVNDVRYSDKDEWRKAKDEYIKANKRFFKFRKINDHLSNLTVDKDSDKSESNFYKTLSKKAKNSADTYRNMQKGLAKIGLKLYDKRHKK